MIRVYDERRMIELKYNIIWNLYKVNLKPIETEKMLTNARFVILMNILTIRLVYLQRISEIIEKQLQNCRRILHVGLLITYYNLRLTF